MFVPACSELEKQHDLRLKKFISKKKWSEKVLDSIFESDDSSTDSEIVESESEDDSPKLVLVHNRHKIFGR